MYRVVLVLSFFCCAASVFADYGSGSQAVVEILEKVNLGNKVCASVEISQSENGVLEVADQGEFFFQFVVAGIEKSKTFDIENSIDQASLSSLRSKRNVVVLTHGWIDKAHQSWPSEIADAIYSKVDGESWAVVVFDWSGGAGTANPIDAAKYARNIGGFRLTKSLGEIFPNIDHIHLIGHSAGSWICDSAARELVETRKDISVHITLLDAFIPGGWEKKEIGKIENAKQIWVDHYYTKDYTLGSTHRKIASAYNVDLTDIEPGFKEHKFPFRWYYATVTGHYGLEGREKNKPFYHACAGIEYGFPRSKEFSQAAWQQSISLGADQMRIDHQGPLEKIFADIKNLFE